MNEYEALTVLKNATENINTNKNGHDLLAQALATLKKLLPPVELKDANK